MNESAFPVPDGAETMPGMDLRDYFAAKAMQAIITREGHDSLVIQDIAFTAYQYADAMLKEREVPNE